ncbi:MAG: membrane protein insertion efficiency factor YidD [Desulfobacterales bacterium]|nr:membrane protein insertion efficiency factor YidD [Desulfobacterales bacterium]
MVVNIFLAIIKIYQYVVSPVLGPACRFYPTCSSYSYQAILRHGPVAGAFFAMKRILRCHPFHPGGYDPVPEQMVRDDPGRSFFSRMIRLTNTNNKK